jgi:predicted HicB family RNase H-like nuclease
MTTMKIAGYTAKVWIDPEHRELVGSVRVAREGVFTFRAKTFPQLERECAKSARVLETEKKRAKSKRAS